MEVSSSATSDVVLVSSTASTHLSPIPSDSSISISSPIPTTAILLPPSSSTSLPAAATEPPLTSSPSIDSDPFGPPADDWATSSSSSSSSVPSVSIDPFAGAVVEEEAAVFTPHAFDAFPRPKAGEGGTEVKEEEAARKKKRAKGKKKKAAAEAARLPTPVSADSAVDSVATVTSAVSVGELGSVGEETTSGGGGLLMPDSAEYLAMLEHRLERLKKKQEMRAKEAKTARRTTEFVSITTSEVLNEDERRGQAVSEEKKEGDLIDAVHPAAATASGAAPLPGGSGGGGEAAGKPAQHRATIGMHSSPFSEEEAQSIMSAAVPAGAVEVVREDGEVVEDESRMVSSDNVPVGVVADKSAVYEHLDDQQQCVLM